MIGSVTSSGALPALEKLVRFSAQRQQLIAHNIANISTPDFRQQDVSVSGFQESLRRAVQERRGRTGGMQGELRLAKTREVMEKADGRLELTPRTPDGGILFHDRNNRDIERLMQDLAENAGVFRVATDLLKNQMDQLRAAIRESA